VERASHQVTRGNHKMRARIHVSRRGMLGPQGNMKSKKMGRGIRGKRQGGF